MKNKTHRVEITYDAKYWPEYDDVIKSKLGYCDGSGLGFGVRDMEWYFDSKFDAINFLQRAKSIVGIKIAVDMYPVFRKEYYE